MSSFGLFSVNCISPSVETAAGPEHLSLEGAGAQPDR